MKYRLTWKMEFRIKTEILPIFISLIFLTSVKKSS